MYKQAQRIITKQD